MKSKPTYPKRPNSRSGSLGQFLRSRERMIHTSVRIVRNPLAAMAEAQHEPFDGPQYLPTRGVTYRKTTGAKP